jgi:hypothetical protein
MQQTNSVNTNAQDQFEVIHLTNTVFLSLAPPVEQIENPGLK